MTDHDDLQDRLHALGSQPVDSARQSADLTAMASLRPASRLLPKLRVAAAFLAGLLIGGTGLAAANALPDQAQHVAHRALGSVGVDVPNPPRYWKSECGPQPDKVTHGAYVSAATTEAAKQAAAKSNCGKPDKAAKAGAESDDADTPGNPDKPAKDACHGKPSWAGDKTPDSTAKAAAQAARADCPPDDEAEDEAVDEDTTTPSTEE